jgi:hypothetical protein
LKTIERVMRVMTHVNIGATLGMAAWILWSGMEIVGMPSTASPAVRPPAVHSHGEHAPASHSPGGARPAASDHCCLVRAPVTT